MSDKRPTSKGKPVSEDTIDRLSHQAEDGYDVDTLRRAGGRRPRGSAAASGTALDDAVTDLGRGGE